MTTGKKPASDAGKILRNPTSSKKEKEVAASDLAQAKHKKTTKATHAKPSKTGGTGARKK
jgi:hypothetical protein